jgi:hypothetical protein
MMMLLLRVLQSLLWSLPLLLLQLPLPQLSSLPSSAAAFPMLAAAVA